MQLYSISFHAASRSFGQLRETQLAYLCMYCLSKHGQLAASTAVLVLHPRSEAASWVWQSVAHVESAWTSCRAKMDSMSKEIRELIRCLRLINAMLKILDTKQSRTSNGVGGAHL